MFLCVACPQRRLWRSLSSAFAASYVSPESYTTIQVAQFVASPCVREQGCTQATVKTSVANVSLWARFVTFDVYCLACSIFRTNL